MHFLIIIVLFLLLLYGPQLWARTVLARYHQPREDFPGTGGEFARHLLDKFDLHQVRVEVIPPEMAAGDHYDPVAKAVRLTPDKLDGKTLTAVAVAAHEVGHALQDHFGYEPLVWRTRMVRIAQTAEKTGSGVMFVLPIVAAVTRSPGASALMFFVGIATLGVSTLVHAITLPVEWDASFGRAMPLLKKGEYLSERDLRAAKRILRACALTYLAASMASLLNVWRWLRLWRR
ncbi:zinc metallopeptidase [Pseudomonadota bacterium]